MKWAVLTGDIVASSEIDPDALDEIMRSIQEVSLEASGWGHTGDDETITGFDRRGGDGWQLATNRQGFALRLSLYIQARLRLLGPDYATRIAIATSEGEALDQMMADLNSAHGIAFTASGRLLEELTGHTLMAHAQGGAVDAAFRLADHISQSWTQAQARSLCLTLPPDSGPRRVAAESLGISRQAVDQALNSAGLPALIDALEAIESEQ
ncbi:MarR family transcriptional regulator [Roseovarius pelagicus]|uniref:MarR family transcriptional regulator n=1 Tax=Roseovarius pelagicus TaxID=2980108 RepID=A0ABY6DBW4_9RHOB|nr:MarR family transcriptional regulator [Roseovarius pelagicus]UXX83575.1 MarR family transcriptional regulator [Roseovarius pelagicus]